MKNVIIINIIPNHVTQLVAYTWSKKKKTIGYTLIYTFKAIMQYYGFISSKLIGFNTSKNRSLRSRKTFTKCLLLYIHKMHTFYKN